MPGKATFILLSKAERTELERRIRCATIEYRILLRSKILLLAAKGLETQEIAKQLGISPKAASKELRVANPIKPTKAIANPICIRRAMRRKSTKIPTIPIRIEFMPSLPYSKPSGI